MKYFIGLLCFSAVISLTLVNGEELSSANNKKLKKVKNAFPKSDSNGDNILTLSELHDFVKLRMNDGATSKSNLQLKRLLKEEPDADKNGDSILTKAELLAHLR